MDQLSQEVTIIVFVSLFFVIIIIGIINLILIYQKKQIQYLKEKEQLKVIYENQLLETQIEIQEQTLKNISEEIHDNVGQVLSLAKLNLNTIGNITNRQVQSKIDSTKDLVSKAINDLRNLSRSLHGERIGEIGLQQAIANELKIIQNTGQFKTHLKITGETYKLEPQKEMVLYRIVQEALHNSVKHAKAKNINVQLNCKTAVFNLIITDDGIGFNVAALQSSQTGIGLKSMQSRAALIGGVFAICSSENKGTSITVELQNLNL